MPILHEQKSASQASVVELNEGVGINSNLQLNLLLNYRHKKTTLRWLMCFQISGGVDGTRTRDPRRDRPVF